MTAGFGDLYLGKPPSPSMSGRKRSVSVAPDSRMEDTIASSRVCEPPTSSQDLQTRIEMLGERIAERERKIRTRQTLERLKREEEKQSLRAPPVEITVEKTAPDGGLSMLVELDSHLIPNPGGL